MFMKIFKLVLISFFLITSANSNSIYNLIKIPNLEIYELKTPNKLKYFYTKRPFRLGVDKNIACEGLEKKKYDQKYEIISKNLNRYSKEFVKKINLKYVVLCSNLSISGINTAGIPDNIMRTLILDINFNKKYFERAIHHEIFHIINDQHKKKFNKNKWKKINKPNFKYSKCSTCTQKLGLDTYNKTKGFFSEYSKTTASEDMAEVFSHLMIFKDKINKDDHILNKKIRFIKNNLLKIDNTFKF